MYQQSLRPVEPVVGPVSLDGPSDDSPLVLVDPERIHLAAIGGIADTRRPPEIRAAWRGTKPLVMGGDWDRDAWGTTVRPFHRVPFYRAFRKHFQQGLPWEDTKWYRTSMRRMEAGEVLREMRTEEDFLERCKYYEGLYEDIRDKGYRTRMELGGRDVADDIRVGIARDGRLIVLGGRHRLAIARLLEIPQVPVRIVVRHEEWVEFRSLIEDHARRRWKGRVYQRIDHPDLAHLSSGHGPGRLDVIRGALAGRSWRGRRLLDLGTHWGYWPQQMDRLGFKCVGIEFKPEDADIAERLSPATESSYTVWRGDLTEYPEPAADVTLALSIFHHLITTEELHGRLVDFLQRLDTRIMFFEPPNLKATAKGPKDAYRKYQPDEFAAFVSEYSGLNKVEKLGIGDRRSIYKLTRGKVRRPPRSQEDLVAARRERRHAKKARELAGRREARRAEIRREQEATT